MRSALLALLLVVLFPIEAMSRTACEKLASLSLPDTVVIVARDVPAGAPLDVDIGDINAKVDLPAFCRVSLIVRPQINIEVWLPQRTWNKRFRGEGNGGFGGSVPFALLADSLRGGYATAGTDTGHQSNTGGAFALNADGSLNQQLIDDFAYRSQHEVVLKAKRLIQAYYDAPPEYSYFRGCSGGGRQGLMMVQRFPEEYDGVLAECPAINWARLIPAELWPQIVMREQVGHAISTEKLGLATKAAIAACDGHDGVIDGLISEPRKCIYDPAALVCNDNSGIEICLTAAEANAIRRIWDGPTATKSGARLWFGIERGTSFALAGPEPLPLLLDYFRYWLRRDPAFDWRTMTIEELERDFQLSHATFGKTVGTDNPDLHRFRQHGGKLIISHGEGDEIIPSRGTLDYFNRVVAANGRSETGNFVRLYMMPGVSHTCSWAPGNSATAPFPTRLFDALVDWVEKDTAPGSVVALQRLPSGTVRTRIVCPHPQKAKWTGKGSSDDATAYVCASDTEDQELSPTEHQHE